MKKFNARAVLGLFLVIALIAPISTPIYAGGVDVENEITEDVLAPASFEIAAKSGILMDEAGGTVLYEKNPHEKMAPASITKIMTMLLVMEALENGKIKLEDSVVTSANASSMGGTQIWLKENEQMSVKDLLTACAVASANDAAMALAEYVGGSEEGFVAMMNNKALELKMKDTTFINPTGLDADGHVSSAYDIALMSRALLKYKEITEYTSIWMTSLRDGKTELVNTNKLVRFYKGCTGLKTGTTGDAGSCVSVTATKEGLSLVSVVMGCTTSKDRFNSAKQLLDFGFSGFSSYSPKIEPEMLMPVKVIGGILPEVEVETPKSSSIIIKKGKSKDIVQKINIAPDVGAPVLKGQKLGEIKLSVDGEEIASFSLNAKEAIDKVTVFNAMDKLFSRVISM